MYGTAWKEERIEVRQALDAGFRALNTANRRRHYFEAGVGAMEAQHAAARTRFLGVTNVSLEQLASLCEHAASSW